MRMSRNWLLIIALVLSLSSISIAWAASSDTPPPGTVINKQNWQQYKQYMPLGMVKLFEGQYFWKMPSDVEIEVGPTHLGSRLKSFQDATEKYSPQVRVEQLPNGHYKLDNYHGGIPFHRLQFQWQESHRAHRGGFRR